MFGKEQAGQKELEEIMKSISIQRGRRPRNFASKMPTTWKQIFYRFILILNILILIK